MIRFLTTGRNRDPLRWYLESYGARLRALFAPAAYEDVLADPGALEDPRATATVFADLELLTSEQRERAAAAGDRLSARGHRVLNHPARSLRRYDLLRRLHDLGRNSFGVRRAGDAMPPRRFPVFVRGEDDHEGSRSALLRTPVELSAALERAAADGAGDLLVVEFVGTADADGITRKYGAFRVGDRILARHVFFSRAWMVKDRDLLHPRFLREEREYVEENPHADALREVFEIAGIEYGRVDYAVRDGRIEVWEVNTNPVIVGLGRGGRVARAFARLPARLRCALAPLAAPGLRRAATHARFAAGLEEAWRSLARPAGA